MTKPRLLANQQIVLSLVLSGLLCTGALAQPVPDVQWTRPGSTLAATADGNVVTTEQVTDTSTPTSPSRTGSVLVKYSPEGNQLWRMGPLEGGFYIGGRIPGYPYEVLFITHTAGTYDGGIAVVGGTSLRGALVATKVFANGSIRRWEDSDLFGYPGDTFVEDIVGTPDGGFLILLTVRPYALNAYVVVRKYDINGNFSWSKEVAYPASSDNKVTKGEAVIVAPDGGYLIVGYHNTTGQIIDGANTTLIGNPGWVAKLDGAGNVSWQKLLNSLQPAGDYNGPFANSVAQMLPITDATITPNGSGFVLVGFGLPPHSVAVPPPTTALVELNADGSLNRARIIGTVPTESFITQYSRNGANAYAVGNSARQNGIDPQVTVIGSIDLPQNNASLFSVTGPRVYDSSPDGSLRGIDRIGDGGLVFLSSAGQLVKLRSERVTPPPPSGFQLTQPTYNCQTGAITFNTTGGDGTPITFSAPGITRSSPTSNTGVIEQELRNDPKPITIQATQSGQTATYVFDFKAFCTGTPPPPPPPVDGPLTLLEPTYDCATGAIRFNTSGGDGSPIEFRAIGITDWTTNPNQFVDAESRTANDVQPFTLQARQSGREVTYTWNLKAACGRARLGVTELPTALTLRTLGNPVTNAVTVEVTGATGQSVQLRLVDGRGRLVSTQQIDRAGLSEQRTFDLRQQPTGLFMLQATTPRQTRTVKVIRQ